MATELIREKLNALNNWIASESLQIYQHELLVRAAAATSGDKQVDEEMKKIAQNSKAVILASSRRLAVYKEEHEALSAELNRASDQP